MCRLPVSYTHLTLPNISLANGAFPVIKAEASQPLTYFAKISGDAPNAKDVNAANVVFTIAIVD